jgi:hypothetical protein
MILSSSFILASLIKADFPEPGAPPVTIPSGCSAGCRLIVNFFQTALKASLNSFSVNCSNTFNFFLFLRPTF